MANAYDQAFGTFADVTRAGSRDAVIDLPGGAKAGLVTATHSGSGNFALSVLDANNQPTGDLLVNTIGKYSGTSIYGVQSFGERGVKIKLSASGSWTVLIQQVSKAPQLGADQKGQGDKVFLYDGPATQAAITNVGKGNFVVAQRGGDFPNLAVNEIGNYNGTVPFSKGPSVVEVTSDGNWTLKLQ